MTNRGCTPEHYSKEIEKGSKMLFQRLRTRLRTPVALARELNAKVDALVQGSANESRLLSENFKAIIEGLNNQSKLLNAKLSALVDGSANESRLLN